MITDSWYLSLRPLMAVTYICNSIELWQTAAAVTMVNKTVMLDQYFFYSNQVPCVTMVTKHSIKLITYQYLCILMHILLYTNAHINAIILTCLPASCMTLLVSIINRWYKRDECVMHIKVGRTIS